MQEPTESYVARPSEEETPGPETDPLLATVIHPTAGKSKLFLEGPAGAGKTTLAVRRLLHLLQSGVPARSILVWVPQRVLAGPYYDALWERDLPGGEVTVVTIGGLARRMIGLFWPLVAEKAGFAYPNREPIFLTLETTQYYMDRIAGPYIDAGYLDGLSIRRNRLMSQIIDNLNKAAVVGFPHTSIATRLKQAWGGESARERAYEQAQECANGFRAYCLAHNLLDFSLQYDLFFGRILNEPACRTYLFRQYRHLIVDNIEEDTPRAHDLLREWLEACETALVVMDQDAGYRAFLGADPQSAAQLKWLCQDWVALEQSHVSSPAVAAVGQHLVRALGSEVSQALLRWSPRSPGSAETDVPVREDPRQALRFDALRYQPQMCEWVAEQVADLIQQQGVPPGEIAILAPYLGDALRFALTEALARRNVPIRSHRPSRALRDEPATRCLLTLAAIAHPTWGQVPAQMDVAQALMVAIEGLDLVRARLLTQAVYRPREGRPAWLSFDQVDAGVQQRISFLLGGRFERLRRWLEDYAASPVPALDDWVSLLFAEVLSRPGFSFHHNLDAGRVTAALIESVAKFRDTVQDTLIEAEHGPDDPTARLSADEYVRREYIRMVEQGVFAATYVQSWQVGPADAVLIAPAYTFLMANRPVEVQFWLNIGSGGWWERLYQPLTHPYVLSRQWPEGQVWGDDDEFSARQMALGKLILGLVRRCRRTIYLGIADLGEQGNEERGPLLQAVQRLLRRASG